MWLVDRSLVARRELGHEFPRFDRSYLPCVRAGAPHRRAPPDGWTTYSARIRPDLPADHRSRLPSCGLRQETWQVVREALVAIEPDCETEERPFLHYSRYSGLRSKSLPRPYPPP